MNTQNRQIFGKFIFGFSVIFGLFFCTAGLYFIKTHWGNLQDLVWGIVACVAGVAFPSFIFFVVREFGTSKKQIDLVEKPAEIPSGNIVATNFIASLLWNVMVAFFFFLFFSRGNTDKVAFVVLVIFLFLGVFLLWNSTRLVWKSFRERKKAREYYDYLSREHRRK